MSIEQIIAIFESSLEDAPRASQNVRDTYKGFCNSVDSCIEAIQRDCFLWAYKLGYEAGRAAV